MIVLDYGLPTEQVYHCGASSKDAGKKLCAINVISETNMIHPVIDKLLLASDKQILVESRPENYAEEWLKTMDCPMIRVDGTKPVDANIDYILEYIK